ncbi:S8 family peptidase [Rubripirellula reticaptiva]|uniref:Peptidase S8/S53 domain-containing protein n=1 Tax=Rubripirellula reticaptiva TaxID=2528013 RepID=A0A5C6F8U1_9BACT|nr:S8 family peptidase [Rubripirellula reticaptiva]TWU55931.1 hypothetical protein Poly59_22340 [Rubripirellula reticaptiva]
MADQPRFLLGNGHNLTSRVKVTKILEPKPPPYDIKTAKARLAPQFSSTAKSLAEIPDAACPDDYAVALLTLHPEYTAKSYFPGELLREARMEAIGSRPARVKPQAWNKKASPEEAPTTQLYVAASRRNFASFANQLPGLSESDTSTKQLFEIEVFKALDVNDRTQRVDRTAKDPLLEVVLHTSGVPRAGRIVEAFEEYADTLNLRPDFDRRFEVGSLCFLPVRAANTDIDKLGQFAFLRTIRQMPELRPMKPIIRTSGKSKPFAVKLPKDPPLDPQVKAAVFDGGLTDEASFGSFVHGHEPVGIGAPVETFVDHGTSVTSALLYGPLRKGDTVRQPYGQVDHYRVLDDHSAKDPYDLYDTLARIRDVLQVRKYGFVNLSIGPSLPIEDDDVHAWTAVLDSLLSSGETLATVAIGNAGEKDRPSGNARVQVPSDSVNALAVGATDRSNEKWARAKYSCYGPGRSPGVIKPEVVSFGGCSAEPFFVMDSSLTIAIPEAGTSLASPATLRLGMGVRAHFGADFSALAIKALLVHCCEPHETQSSDEIGWGRVPGDVEQLVVCGDGVARVVFQGELTPGQYLRAPVPMPAGKLTGMVSISATFCFASETDPNDPGNYTRGGLDVTFRPNADKYAVDAAHPKSSSFFRSSDYDTEGSLRRNAHKWETTLHRQRSFQPKSLKDPMFDVHYQVRESGRTTRASDKIRYAMIVTINAPKMPDLYDKIVQRFQTQIEPMTPLIEVPIRV